MNVMDLAIQIIEPLIAKDVMYILRHIEFMQLMQHHPLKLWVHRAFVLWRVIKDNVHWSNSELLLFLLPCST